MLHVSKGHKALGHENQGLGHPPEWEKSSKEAPHPKNAALSLSHPSWTPAHLSLTFGPSPLSFANGQDPLSLACVQRAKLANEVAG